MLPMKNIFLKKLDFFPFKLEVVHWYTSVEDTKNGILLIHRIHESDKIHDDDRMSAMPKIKLPSKRIERVEQTKITSWTNPFVLLLSLMI